VTTAVFPVRSNLNGSSIGSFSFFGYQSVSATIFR
jgi:hypothetical protein